MEKFEFSFEENAGQHRIESYKESYTFKLNFSFYL